MSMLVMAIIALAVIIDFLIIKSVASKILVPPLNEPVQTQELPDEGEEALEVEVYKVISETVRDVSAYNVGDINQCSGDPCISANGENVCLALEMGYNRCAANFVPFGTELLIFSEETGWSHHCVVTDRMNKRYPNSVDIAMKLSEHDRAIKFGRQKLNVRVLEKVK